MLESDGWVCKFSLSNNQWNYFVHRTGRESRKLIDIMASDHSDTLLIAVTPTQQCIGIRLFPCRYNPNGITYRHYLNACVINAYKFQMNIESGVYDPREQAHPCIITNPSVQSHVLNSIVSAHVECKY